VLETPVDLSIFKNVFEKNRKLEEEKIKIPSFLLKAKKEEKRREEKEAESNFGL
jgi:hypothetical protein